MQNLENKIEKSFFGKVKASFGRIKNSVAGRIAVYSLVGALSVGAGYGCGGSEATAPNMNISETYGTDTYQTDSKTDPDGYLIDIPDVYQNDILKTEVYPSDLKDIPSISDLSIDEIGAGYDAGKAEIEESIPCGTYTCKAKVEVCCVDVLSGKEPICINAQDTCEGIAITCNGHEDCIDTLCCVEAMFKIDIPQQEVNGNTKCTPYCNFSFDSDTLSDFNPLTGQIKITARACHDSGDCATTEPICCNTPGYDVGMCLTTLAVSHVKKYTFGLMNCK